MLNRFQGFRHELLGVAMMLPTMTAMMMTMAGLRVFPDQGFRSSNPPLIQSLLRAQYLPCLQSVRHGIFLACALVRDNRDLKTTDRVGPVAAEDELQPA